MTLLFTLTTLFVIVAVFIYLFDIVLLFVYLLFIDIVDIYCLPHAQLPGALHPTRLVDFTVATRATHGLQVTRIYPTFVPLRGYTRLVYYVLLDYALRAFGCAHGYIGWYTRITRLRWFDLFTVLFYTFVRCHTLIDWLRLFTRSRLR